mmetsp:Transcript_62083/g.72589  ORF Transcript_62083/g.72589 Transcript_62083/m.72589 type:complete len:377 (+) Transcript_62083:41-1171(+)
MKILSRSKSNKGDSGRESGFHPKARIQQGRCFLTEDVKTNYRNDRIVKPTSVQDDKNIAFGRKISNGCWKLKNDRAHAKYRLRGKGTKSQRKQTKDRLRSKQVKIAPLADVSRVSQKFNGDPLPQVAVYERGMVYREAVQKKLREIEVSMIPEFSPQIFTTHTFFIDDELSNNNFHERLYNPNYLKEREEKLTAMKTHSELEGCTFAPMITSLSSPSTPVSSPAKSLPMSSRSTRGGCTAWDRLYNISKMPKFEKPSEPLDPECSFMPNISVSQRHVTRGGEEITNTPIYERLHAYTEFIRTRRELRHAMELDCLQFSPKINKYRNIGRRSSYGQKSAWPSQKIIENMPIRSDIPHTVAHPGYDDISDICTDYTDA